MLRIITTACSIITLCTLMGITSCVKKDFDAPPDKSTYDPKIPVTHTIAQLQAMQQGKAIDSDVVISGIVVMDDKSGNYYKKMVIQDATGGMEILIDQYNLYNDYPVGRKVYLKCKGLFLGNYGQNLQLGYTPDQTGTLSNIPAVLVSDFIVKANYPNPIIPDTVTLSQLASPNGAKKYLNTLVAIKKVEFAEDNVGIPYAQLASLASATNLTVQDCSGGKITMRNSGYSKFQPYITPSGNGVLVGIYTRYNTTPQLYIRDTNDVKFNGSRCDGTTPGPQIFSDGFNNLNNWTPVSVEGAQQWAIANYGNPKPCVSMSGYQGGNFANEDWLISKAIDLNGYNTLTLTFETAGKYTGNQLQCYVSDNYSSGAPNTATWTLLSAVYDQSGNFQFTNSGNIDLSAYKNKQIRIAFKYTSTTTAAATWEVDNVKIEGQ